MAKIIELTTMSNSWNQIQIAIDEDRRGELWNLFLTPEFETKMQQGISEGWIVVLGEV